MADQARSPRTVAYALIQATSLAEAARSTPGALGDPAPDWAMHRALTDTLQDWQAAGALPEMALSMIEHLTVELVAYRFQVLGDQDRLERWLHDFGDQVCRVQQHAHPVGPTAIEIVSVVAADLTTRAPGPLGADRVARMAAAFLHYLRAGHEVEDVRELAETIAMWAGSQLAALMLNDVGRITRYLNAREPAARP